MVNQDVVNYLREGKKRGFSVHLLKRKLLEGGFQENEIEEAIIAIEVDEKKSAVNSQAGRQNIFAQPEEFKPNEDIQSDSSLFSQQPGRPFSQNKESPLIRDESSTQMSRRGETSGFKWMKTAGICAIILFIIGLAYGIITTVNPASSSLLVDNAAVGVLSITIILLLFFFYYFGFVKLGKQAGERILSMGSWITIISVIVSGILIVIVSRIVPAQLTSVSSLKNTMTIISIIWVVVFLLVLVGQMLFSIGLIKAGRQVKFAKAAGILNVTVFVAGLMFIAGAIMLIYALLNLFSSPTVSITALVNISSLGTSAYITVYSIIGMYVLKIISMVLEFLCLFKASKQFEN